MKYLTVLQQGFFHYRYEADDEVVCRGHVPYLYDRQREMISFLRFRYRYTCTKATDRFYATTAPQEMINRMAEADKIVAEYVKDNGVMAKFDKGARKVISSKFTTKKMRDWYLQQSSEKAE